MTSYSAATSWASYATATDRASPHTPDFSGHFCNLNCIAKNHHRVKTFSVVACGGLLYEPHVETMICGCDFGKRIHGQEGNQEGAEPEHGEEKKAPVPPGPPSRNLPPQDKEDNQAPTASDFVAETANHIGTIVDGEDKSSSRKKSIEKRDYVESACVTQKHASIPCSPKENNYVFIDVIQDLPTAHCSGLRVQSCKSAYSAPLDVTSSTDCSCPMYEINKGSNYHDGTKQDGSSSRLPCISRSVDDGSPVKAVRKLITRRREVVFDLNLPEGIRVNRRGHLIEDRGVSAEDTYFELNTRPIVREYPAPLSTNIPPTSLMSFHQRETLARITAGTSSPDQPACNEPCQRHVPIGSFNPRCTIAHADAEHEEGKSAAQARHGLPQPINDQNSQYMLNTSTSGATIAVLPSMRLSTNTNSNRDPTFIDSRSQQLVQDQVMDHVHCASCMHRNGHATKCSRGNMIKYSSACCSGSKDTHHDRAHVPTYLPNEKCARKLESSCHHNEGSGPLKTGAQGQPLPDLTSPKGCHVSENERRSMKATVNDTDHAGIIHTVRHSNEPSVCISPAFQQQSTCSHPRYGQVRQTGSLHCLHPKEITTSTRTVDACHQRGATAAIPTTRCLVHGTVGVKYNSAQNIHNGVQLEMKPKSTRRQQNLRKSGGNEATRYVQAKSQMSPRIFGTAGEDIASPNEPQDSPPGASIYYEQKPLVVVYEEATDQPSYIAYIRSEDPSAPVYLQNGPISNQLENLGTLGSNVKFDILPTSPVTVILDVILKKDGLQSDGELTEVTEKSDKEVEVDGEVRLCDTTCVSPGTAAPNVRRC
ncbi:uncharacterized protein LOC135383357 [Ornithodoros turicata]|uniref:uncharacterized protein LOC135383357 n=1 Tax=Ornithodoros turicata TaxID=34597 RepID=UPI003138757B